MVHFVIFHFVLFYFLTSGLAFPLLFPPLIFPQQWMNSSEGEPFSSSLEQTQSQNLSNISFDSMENWFEMTATLGEHGEDNYGVTEPITTFPDPDEMYSPHLHDKYFTSEFNRKHQTDRPYYANGSAVVINREYFRTQHDIEPTIGEYEKESSITESAPIFPDPDEMYSPHLHDKYFTSQFNRKHRISQPYYANGSAVVINGEYFRTRDDIEPTINEYENEWSITESVLPTIGEYENEWSTTDSAPIFPDPDEMYSPHLHDKYFTSEFNRKHQTDRPYYANGSAVVINREYFRTQHDIEPTIGEYENESSITESAPIFPGPDEMHSPHLHDKYFTSQFNHKHQTDDTHPYYNNGSTIVINNEYFKIWNNIAENSAKCNAAPYNKNSSTVYIMKSFNKTSNRNELKNQKKRISNINEEITTHSQCTSEDGIWSNLVSPPTLNREKRDLDVLNDTYEDISWALHQPLDHDAMEDILETSTLSASEEKLYRYYETKTWPTLNGSSVTLYQFEESEDESERKTKRRRKYHPNVETTDGSISSSEVNFSMTLRSSQFEDSENKSGSTIKLKLRKKKYSLDPNTTYKISSQTNPVTKFLKISTAKKPKVKHQKPFESVAHQKAHSPSSKHKENQTRTTFLSYSTTVHMFNSTFTYTMPTPPPSLSESQEKWYAAYDKKLESTLSMDQFRPGDPTWWQSWPSTFWDNFTVTTYPPYHPFNATIRHSNNSFLPIYNFRSYEEWKNHTLEQKRLLNVTSKNIDDSYEDYSNEYYNTNLSDGQKRQQTPHFISQKVPVHNMHSFPTPNIYLTPSECTKKKSKHQHYRGRGKLPKSKKRPKFLSRKKETDISTSMEKKKMKKGFRRQVDMSLSSEFITDFETSRSLSISASTTGQYFMSPANGINCNIAQKQTEQETSQTPREFCKTASSLKDLTSFSKKQTDSTSDFGKLRSSTQQTNEEPDFNKDEELLTEKELEGIISGDYYEDSDSSDDESHDSSDDESEDYGDTYIESKIKSGAMQKKPKKPKLPKLSKVKQKRLLRKEKKRLLKQKKRESTNLSKHESQSEEKMSQKEEKKKNWSQQNTDTDNQDVNNIVKSAQVKEQKLPDFVEGVGWIDDQKEMQKLLDDFSEEDKTIRRKMEFQSRKSSSKERVGEYDERSERGQRLRGDRNDEGGRRRDSRDDNYYGSQKQFDRRDGRNDRYQNYQENRYESNRESRFGRGGDRNGYRDNGRRRGGDYRESEFRREDYRRGGGTYRESKFRTSGGDRGSKMYRESNFHRDNDRRGGGGYRESRFERYDNRRSGRDHSRETNFRRDNDRRDNRDYKESRFRGDGDRRGSKYRDKDSREDYDGLRQNRKKTRKPSSDHSEQDIE